MVRVRKHIRFGCQIIRRSPYIFWLFLCICIVLPKGAQANPTVCTITINSADEKTVFQKHLAPQGFNFIELTEVDKGKGTSDWFGAACKKNIQCDILLISGHYASHFFGSTGLSLNVAELEGQSCQNTCPGILNSPKEVFLFGCNTLAAQGPQTRTMEEYIQVLRADGHDQGTAERIAESVYGVYGSSNKNRIQRSFLGVPRIYGFSSIAPAGKNVRGLLDQYLSSIPNYAQYLEHIDNKTNDYLKNALRVTSLAQTNGADPTGPERVVSQNICQIADDKKPVESRLSVIGQLLKEGQIQTYIPTMEEFFRQHPIQSMTGSEKQKVEEFKVLSSASQWLRNLVFGLKTIVLKLSLANLARNLGWMSADELANLETDNIQKILRDVSADEVQESLCALGDNLKITAFPPANQINNSYFETYRGLKTLECLKPRNKDILLRISDQLSSSLWSYDVGRLLRTLNAQDTIFNELVAKATSTTEPKKGRSWAMFLLAESGQNRNKAIQILSPFLKETDPILLYSAIASLIETKPSDPQLQNELVDLTWGSRTPLDQDQLDELRKMDFSWVTNDEAQAELISVVAKGDVDTLQLSSLLADKRLTFTGPKAMQSLLNGFNDPNQKRADFMGVILQENIRTNDYATVLTPYLKSSNPRARYKIVDMISLLQPNQLKGQTKLWRRQVFQALVSTLNDSSTMIKVSALESIVNINQIEKTWASREILVNVLRWLHDDKFEHGFDYVAVDYLAHLVTEGQFSTPDKILVKTEAERLYKTAEGDRRLQYKETLKLFNDTLK
jgi:hypothetical protein